LLAFVDQQTGTTTHINAARWFDVNVTRGLGRSDAAHHRSLELHGIDPLLPAARSIGAGLLRLTF